MDCAWEIYGKIVGRKFFSVHTLKKYEKFVLMGIHIALSIRCFAKHRFELRFNWTVFHRRTTTLMKTSGVYARHRDVDTSAALRCVWHYRTSYHIVVRHYRCTTLPPPPLKVTAIKHFSRLSQDYSEGEGRRGTEPPPYLLAFLRRCLAPQHQASWLCKIVWKVHQNAPH